MRVHARQIDWHNIPTEISPFISKTQTFVTRGKIYSVNALSIYQKILFLLVIDDLETPVFLPAWLFEVIETDIPSDWICNLLPEEGNDLILGPPFVAESIDAYNAMIDQEYDQVEKLWKWQQATMRSVAEEEETD